MLVVKDGSVPEVKIAELIRSGQYDAAVEEDKQNDLCVVYAKDYQLHEYLLDLFCGFDPVPLPQKDTGDLHIFYTAATIEKSAELMADDFSVVIDGFMYVIVPGAVVALGPPMNSAPLTQRAINMHRFAFEDARKYQEGLEEW